LRPHTDRRPSQDALKVVLGLALVWVPVLSLNLTPALFAGLIIYGATRSLAARLKRLGSGVRYAEALALMGLLLVVSGGIALLADLASDAGGGPWAFSALLQKLAVTLEQLRGMLPAWVATHLPASVDALREAVAAWLRSHASEVQLWGGHTLRGVGYTLAGMVIAGLAVLQLPVVARPAEEALDAASLLRCRFEELVESFTNVVFAQVRIATINAALTAVFILGVLPMLGKPLPMAGTLVAVTFVAGLVPVVGNLVSNTVIVLVSLSHSLGVAAGALAWLVIIHKLEYFLNAHIIGNRIRAQAWELLIAMILMEAMFGLSGLISAPVIYAQLKAALKRVGWLH
jgi:predicted PurR-regulated permease PerM